MLVHSIARPNCFKIVSGLEIANKGSAWREGSREELTWGRLASLSLGGAVDALSRLSTFLCHHNRSWLNPRRTTTECIAWQHSEWPHYMDILYIENLNHCTLVNWWIARRLCDPFNRWLEVTRLAYWRNCVRYWYSVFSSFLLCCFVLVCHWCCLAVLVAFGSFRFIIIKLNLIRILSARPPVRPSATLRYCI